MKAIISLLLSCCFGASFAQLSSSPEKVALRSIEKQRWQKAESRLRKTLEKDNRNPAVCYVFSIFYFHPNNPSYQLDSAYRYVVSSLDAYAASPARGRERLKRVGVDSLDLITLRAKIDSTAFAVARTINTETAYLNFLSRFPSAVQRDLAAELRDQVAYQDAVARNTHEAFYQYLTRYPDARKAPEARAHYDRLLYFDMTKDRRLSSYEKFLDDHPETTYRDEIYRNIFEISTADGRISSFLSFMTRYPASSLVEKARQIVFHLLAEEEDPRWPANFLNDSLQSLLDANAPFLVPFFKNGLYGFMDERGMEVMTPKYRSIHSDYLCGRIDDQILIVDNQLVARNGNAIFHGVISDLSDLGAGFLKVQSIDDIKVIHKSGLLLFDSLQDAHVIARSFLALKKKNNWYLYTLAGRLLGGRHWEDIAALGDVIVFSSQNRKFIVMKDELGRGAEENVLPLSEPFDDVKPWSRGLIWGRSGEYEGVFNQSLESVIGFDNHKLTQTSFGALATVVRGYVLYNAAGKRSATFDQVTLLSGLPGVRKNNSWFLYEPSSQQVVSAAYDSLRAEGPFIVGLRSDTTYIHFAHNLIRPFLRPREIAFIPGLDSTSCLTVKVSGNAKDVFDLKGEKLFSATFDAIEYAGNGTFVITRNDRKGLVNMRGDVLLPVEFDAIGTINKRVISVLKNKKFGAFHLDKQKLIKPQYDRNLIPYTDALVVTYREGYYGFLGWDNKPLGAFEFDEVSNWNDSLALVRKGSLWSVYDPMARRIVEPNISSIRLVRDTDDEKIAIVQKNNHYGVISNNGKTVIPPTFSEIINLGSQEAPLYFTEKHVPEASLYIVIYYDAIGEMLRKEIYDDEGDYDKIYCSDQ